MCKILIMLISTQANAYTFTYKSGDVIVIKQSTIEIAYKQAAKQCFSILTKGKYPGEERGLEIIDICANPKVSNGK